MIINFDKRKAQENHVLIPLVCSIKPVCKNMALTWMSNFKYKILCYETNLEKKTSSLSVFKMDNNYITAK